MPIDPRITSDPGDASVSVIWNNAEQGNAYQSPAWARVYAEYPDVRPYFFVIDDDSGPVAFLLCFGWRSGKFHSLFWSGSKGAGGGPVFHKRLSDKDRADLHVRLLTVAFDFCISERYRAASVFTYPGDQIPFEYREVTRIKRYTPLLFFERSEEELMASFSQKSRQYIHGAERAGVVVARGGHDDLALYRDMQIAFARERHLPVGRIRPLGEMRRSFDILEKEHTARLYVARCGGEVVGMTIMLYSSDTMFHHSVVVSTHGRKIHVPQAIQWKVMKDALAMGLKAYNLVGAPDSNGPRAGTTEFKLKFGGRIESFNGYSWRSASLGLRLVEKIFRMIEYQPEAPIIFYP